MKNISRDIFVIKSALHIFIRLYGSIKTICNLRSLILRKWHNKILFYSLSLLKNYGIPFDSSVLSQPLNTMKIIYKITEEFSFQKSNKMIDADSNKTVVKMLIRMDKS